MGEGLKAGAAKTAKESKSEGLGVVQAAATTPNKRGSTRGDELSHVKISGFTILFKSVAPTHHANPQWRLFLATLQLWFISKDQNSSVDPGPLLF